MTEHVSCTLILPVSFVLLVLFYFICLFGTVSTGNIANVVSIDVVSDYGFFSSFIAMTLLIG